VSDALEPAERLRLLSFVEEHPAVPDGNNTVVLAVDYKDGGVNIGYSCDVSEFIKG